MKKRIIFLIALPLLAACATLLVLNPGLLRWEDAGPRDFLNPEETSLLQDGDIILRRGVGLPSDLIIHALGEGTGVSHSAFIFFNHGVPWVVHTVSPSLSGIDGVQTQTLEDFNRNSRPDSVVVVRPGYPPEGRSRLRAAAYRYLAAGIPFDGSYDFTSREKMYCTEFIWQVLVEAGAVSEDRLLPFRGPVMGFLGFLEDHRFTVVLDHRKSL